MTSRDSFKKAAKSYNAIPIYESLVFDAHTVLTAFYQFLSHDKFVFLEGVSAHAAYGRYSYLALDPYLEFESFESHYEIYCQNEKKKTQGTVYDGLNELLKRFSYPEDAPDYYAGLFGQLSYECASHLESLQLPDKRSLGTSFASFIVPKMVFIFDKHYHTVTLARTIFIDDPDNMDLDACYDDALADISNYKSMLSSVAPIEPVFLDNKIDHYDQLEPETNMSKDMFLQHVKRCKEYIYNGDIFQIQISRRASVPIKQHPFALYRYLRNFNPSPLLFYTNISDYQLIGASPEILVNVHHKEMQICPIAGTRKRYSRDRSEEDIVNELLNDEKERAEHIMLVDLARNDIGRACDVSTVKVRDLMSIEKYTHVIHMVSDVVGTLSSDCNAVDALKYGFPAGTVAGAPKIRAMEIIAECESEHREFYSGGVAFFDFKGNLKTALSIRTICIKDGVAHTQAAAGVVADSDPEMEYKETCNKMRSSLSAMFQCGDVK